MLTQSDIDEITRIVKDELDDKIKLLPTKDQYFERMDSLSGQIKTLQETINMHDGQHLNIDDNQEDTDKRLKVIEDKLNISPPVTSVS